MMITAQEAKRITGESIPMVIKSEIEKIHAEIHRKAKAGFYFVQFTNIVQREAAEYFSELGYDVEISNNSKGSLITISWEDAI
jgi:hypothetical protein